MKKIGQIFVCFSESPNFTTIHFQGSGACLLSLDCHGAVIRQYFGSHQTVIKQSSVSHRTVFGKSSGSHWAVIGQSLDHHQQTVIISYIYMAVKDCSSKFRSKQSTVFTTK